MQLQTLPYVIEVKVAFLINKPPLAGEHDFPLTEIVGWMAHVTMLFMHYIRVV